MRTNRLTYLFIALGLAPAAHADWSSTLWLTADHQDRRHVLEEDARDAFYSEGQLFGLHTLAPDQQLGIELRAFWSSQQLDVPDQDTGRVSAQQETHYLALRQLWWQWAPTGWTGYPGEQLRIGRLRLKNADPQWWDTNIEALSWSLDTTTSSLQFAVGQPLANFRTDKNPLTNADQHKLRLLAHWRQDWAPYQALSLNSVFARQSGVADSDAPAGDPTGINGKWWWLGVAADSGWYEAKREQQPVAYHLGTTLLLGQADIADSSGGLTDTTLRAWAMDGGVRYDWWLPQRVGLGALFSYGSGGGNGSTSHRYLPTGLDSSLGRFLGNRQPLTRFNDVLRADPTNLQQWGVFASADLTADLELGAMYSLYRRVKRDQPIYTDGSPLAVTEGGSREIGQGLDMVGAWYFHQVFGHAQEGRVRVRGALFETGNAFDEANQRDQRWAMDLMLMF